MNNNTLDYRKSHVEEGKGKVYHESFEIYPFRKYQWEWEKSILKKILDKKLNNDSTILDFACGTGRILNFLNAQSKNVTGVDLSDAMLEVSKKNLPDVEIIKADITKDNIFKGIRSFDVITAFRFFLNAQDSLRIEVLNALNQILKEDGIFIFNNHGNALGIGTFLGKWVIDVKNLFRSADNQYVYNILSESKIKRLLNKSGFEIIETYHRSIFPILNEKTKFDVSRIEGMENWFSSIKTLRPFARNVIYVCKKM
jgi:SAM-dependent methyltransferase